MKFNGNQRNLYLLALILLIVAVALACVWTFWYRDAGDAPEAPAPSAAATGTTALPGATPAPTDAGTVQTAAGADEGTTEKKAEKVSTIVYYQDNYGYLVPVMCRMDYQDGIAKATLAKMVKSSENDMNAARLGLRTILPEGTEIDLDIRDGVARIDLSEEVLNLEDAAAESSMISAIVQTLTEFESVKKVEFLIDGQQREKLKHGTSIAGQFTRQEINPETSVETMSIASLEPVKLYFPCESGSVVVPVTRMVHSRPDVNTAVLELAKGPDTESPLERALPAGCGLIDVKVENGVAKINFTGEFAHLAEHSDGGRMALKALVLTCTQFEGVERVEIYVEGEPYEPGEGTLDVPGFANVAEEIVNNYIQTQSDLIFDFD